MSKRKRSISDTSECGQETDSQETNENDPAERDHDSDTDTVIEPLTIPDNIQISDPFIGSLSSQGPIVGDEEEMLRQINQDVDRFFTQLMSSTQNLTQRWNYDPYPSSSDLWSSFQSTEITEHRSVLQSPNPSFQGFFNSAFYSNIERYSVNDYARARQSFRRMINNQRSEVSVSILNTILDNGIHSKQELLEHFLNNRCLCLSAFSRTELSLVFEHYLFTLYTEPVCEEVPHVLNYYTLQRSMPSFDQLLDFLANQASFLQDPEQYHNRDRQHTPVLCVDKLEKKVVDSTLTSVACGICHSDFEIGQTVLVLSPCKHVFHSNDSECLGESSVLTWMHQHNFCPMCKAKICVL